MKTRSSIFFLLVLFSGLSRISFAQELKFIDSKEGVLLMEGVDSIFFYQSETKSIQGEYPRANYIHPFYGLHGEVLTEDFPDDHLHQRGIYWAWHQLWVDDYRVGDPWACTGIIWNVERIEKKISEGKAILDIKLFWIGEIPVGGENILTKLVEENTRITFYRSGDNSKGLEFDIRLIALVEDLKIGGSEDNKGYSGFSARVFLPEDIVFISKKGIVEPEVTAVEAGNWVDMQGTFDMAGEKKSGITIMFDPKYLNPFHGWILRKEGSMQNPAFPGSEPILLEKGNPFRMRYKILVHSLDWSLKMIDKDFRNFIKNRKE